MVTAVGLSIREAQIALANRELSCIELVEAHLARAETVDSRLGCYTQRFDDLARQAAAAADRELANGAETKPLTGIPIAIKDILSTVEAPTTAQSSAYVDHSVGRDAVVTARLRAAGAIITGKTTTMEFAIGTPDETKSFPIPRNPWDLSAWAGGSSSGSASAVVSGCSMAAIGTDTAGSIRIPAAFCGATGLMPTPGRVPRTGCVPLAWSLDHIGPIARSAEDCGILLDLIAGHDSSDPTSLDAPEDQPAKRARIRIGVDRRDPAGQDPALLALFEAAVDVLKQAGFDVVDVELPHWQELNSAALVIMLSEALAFHRVNLGERWSDYSAGARSIIGSAVQYSGADYVQAQRVRAMVRTELAAMLSDVDAVVTPTCGVGAFALADLGAVATEAEHGGFGPVYTAYWDPTGCPVLTVPIGFTAAGLPLGLQFAAPPFDDHLLVQLGTEYQRRTDWHRRVPPQLS